jgi:hypothetical protein
MLSAGARGVPCAGSLVWLPLTHHRKSMGRLWPRILPLATAYA